MIVADVEEGLATGNAALLREASGLWWFDSSARALKEGYRAKTEASFSAASLNAIDVSKLLPGDFVVTEDGLHTLAYTGGHFWIEADPGVRKVVRVQTPSENIWFSVPVRVVRWRLLISEGSETG
jgi:hypothetical protein